MLSIRLTRVGKTKDSRFRIIVQEKTKAPFSSFIELLGSYNPHTDPATVNLNAERIKHWLSRGAKPSDTIHNILIDQKVIAGEKINLGRKKEKKADKKEKETVPEQEAGKEKSTPAESSRGEKEEKSNNKPSTLSTPKEELKKEKGADVKE